jgi:hypothetical protein
MGIGAAVGVTVLLLNLWLDRPWAKENSAIFFLDGCGLTVVGVAGGGTIGAIIGLVGGVRWYRPVFGTASGTLVDFVLNRPTEPGSGAFLNDKAMSVGVLFAIGGTLVGCIVGSVWPAKQA